MPEANANRVAVCDTASMPLTWFAHQVPVVGMKMARPRWFDGTALVMGSMGPDVAYAVSIPLGVDPNRAPAALTLALPIALVMAVAFRRVVSPVLPSAFADMGPFRVRSFGVLALGHPAWWLTLSSGVLGVGSHIVLDSFTHSGGAGARGLGYDDVTVSLFGITEPLADVLQLVGHTFGTAFGVWLLWFIASHRLLEQWYGEAAVAQVRSSAPSPHRKVVWASAAAGGVTGAVLGWSGELVEQIERPFLGTFVGLTAGCWWLRGRIAPRVWTTTVGADG